MSEIKLYAGVGARTSPPHIITTMTKIASLLASKSYLLRSGGAKGADSAFETGCDSVGGLKEIFTKNSYIPPEAFDLAASVHPAWNKCSPIARRLHGRNSMIILGKNLNTPVNAVICYTPKGKIIGGTGNTIRIAKKYNIPIINLAENPEYEFIMTDFN